MKGGRPRTCSCFCEAAVGEGACDDTPIRAPKTGGSAVGEPLSRPQEGPPTEASGHRNAIAICTAAYQESSETCRCNWVHLYW